MSRDELVADRDEGGYVRGSILQRLERMPGDSLLSLIAAFDRDPRPFKIDLGVGVYRNDAGKTPVPQVVKLAERFLVEQQTSKAYIGTEGDRQFLELIQPLIFGRLPPDRLYGLQTPGGTGALRLAFDLISHADKTATVWVGTPTWVNHMPLLSAAGLPVRTYRYYDPASQSAGLDAMMEALGEAQPGDVVLLHACCHNPTGADLEPDTWRALAERVAARGLMPLIDMAYQGFGVGLDADALATRQVLEAAGEGLVAYSCNKNFGLYRERTGALFVYTPDAATREIAGSNLMALARTNWSMPPDHGAAVVRTILEAPLLCEQWREEVASMRHRIVDLRAKLAVAVPPLAAVARQNGMFSTLPLSSEQVSRLREQHGIYMAGGGRINIAGLTEDNIPVFADALASIL